MSREDLRTRFLNQFDSDRLYEEYPEINPDPMKFCPTCAKEGTYVWKDGVVECDCDLQLQLFKHYSTAGIGVVYQRMNWDDYHGSPDIKELCDLYMAQHKKLISQGIGIVLTGDFGVGKTMSLTLLLKELIWEGYSCFSTTYVNLIDMFSSSWSSEKERAFFADKIKNSEILLIDDLGKENKSKTGFTSQVFDRVLRERVQKGRVTFITTNLTSRSFSEEYGGAAESLISECSIVEEVSGEDYRPIVASKRMDEVRQGLTRPIW